MELLHFPPLPPRSQPRLLNNLTEKKKKKKGVRGGESRPPRPPPQRGLILCGKGQR